METFRVHYKGDKNTEVSLNFDIMWSAVGTPFGPDSDDGVNVVEEGFSYKQICKFPTSNTVSSDPQPPSYYYYDEYYPLFVHDVPLFRETAPKGGSCALNNFTIIDLVVERFDKDYQFIPETFKQSLYLVKLDYKLQVVMPNNNDTMVRYSFRIQGSLKDVPYHTSELL